LRFEKDVIGLSASEHFPTTESNYQWYYGQLNKLMYST